MSFIINNKLIFIETFHFLICILDSVKNSGKYDFKHLSQEFNTKGLDLVNEKGFYFK